MTAGEPAFLVVGYVRKPHGTGGELLVEPLTDHPGDVFVSGVVLLPGDERGREPDPDRPPLRVEAARPFQNGLLVRFAGVGDRSAADRLRGLYLMIERELLPELGEGELFYHQLIGMQVFTADGARVGDIREVYEQRPADLLEIRTEKGTVLVPFLEQWVREVDVERRRLVIDPPEGILDQ